MHLKLGCVIISVGHFNRGDTVQRTGIDTAMSPESKHQPISYRHDPVRAAFTLVELVVVIGIIALVTSIVLPAVNSARSSSRQILCANTVRQICTALFNYSSGYRGALPPNVAAPKPFNWYDFDRVGRLLMASQSAVLGPIATCPEDVNGQRSYAMNVWASSAIDGFISSNGFGKPWKLSIAGASKYILVTEKWSTNGSSAGGWTSTATIATSRDCPGRRFGGGVGIGPLSTRFGSANSELPFQRHRSPKSLASGTASIGRVNIGYADGHVSAKSNAELVDPVSGLSTLDSWWSPLDLQLNF